MTTLETQKKKKPKRPKVPVVRVPSGEKKSIKRVTKPTPQPIAQQLQKKDSTKKRRRRRKKKSNQKVELSKSVGAVVLNTKNQVLLVFQSKNKYWEFPKGKTEGGERELETLKREIEEETGITKFRIAKDFRRVMHYDFQYKGKLIKRRVVYFLIKTQEQVTISDEHTEYVWLNLDRAKERLKHKNQSVLIDDVIKRLKK